MTKKKLSVDKSVIELGRKQKQHIGSNGVDSDGLPVHLPVDADNDGFMPVKAYKEHQQLFEHRLRIPAGTDILTLDPGYYEGSGLINHPNSTTKTTWISNVDVIAGEDGRRVITVFDNISAPLWRRTIHTGGDPASGTGGWARYYGFYTLWRGNSMLTKPVTLSNSLRNDNNSIKYPYILVRYKTNTGDTGVALGDINRVIINSMNLNNNLKVASPDFREAELSFPTSTTAKVIRNKRTNIYMHDNDSTAHMQVMDGVISILEIVGVL
jgi:hypothetical protein